MEALGPLLGKLTALLAGDYGRIRGSRGEICSIRSELDCMCAALKNYTMIQDPGAQVKTWISLVREWAYDTEDVVDKFIHRFSNNQNHVGFKEFFRETAHMLKAFGAQHGIDAQIDHLKARIKQVQESYDFDADTCFSSGHAPLDSWLSVLSTQEAPLVALIGMDGPRDDLAKWIVEEGNNSSKHCRVLSIVGFGGLGKTRLANEVSRQVHEHFNCHVFVSVTQKPNLLELFNNVMSQVSCIDGLAEDTNGWGTGKFIEKLRELLRDKRYLVVIDDIWSTFEWNAIKWAFPENHCSSRIIVTTRIVDVATSCCSGRDDFVYQMQFLSDLHSKRLFLKRIFGCEDYCPDMLIEVSNQILEKCGGLPSAIISISGLLANLTAVQEEWEKVINSIGSAIYRGIILEGMRNILSLSYNYLPTNLKTCLLYFSMFPQNSVIQRERLVRLWISEGFIREVVGLSRQDVARLYFYELIDRSMIQPVDIGYDGKARACRVHGMMFELIVSKSVEENFVMVVGVRKTNWQSRYGFIRRLSVQHIDNEISSELANEDLSHVRSLVVASAVCNNKLPDLVKFEALRVLDLEECEGCAQYIMNNMHKLLELKYLRLRGKTILKLPPGIEMLRGLKTLDLSGTGISQLPPEIVMLHYLNTLDLSGTSISNLPPEIVKLHCLEVLDLRDTHVQELPPGIPQLGRLQHLLISSETRSQKGKTKLPNGIGNMRHLCVMSGFNITNSSIDTVEELGNMTSLRELGIQLNHGGSDEYKRHEEMLLSVLCKIGSRKLRSLCIHKCRGSLEFLDYWSPLPSSLETFCLSGDSCFANIPKWIAPALTSLVHLEISLIELREQGLHTLGELPGLLYLKLSFIADPVEMIMVKGNGFPNLKNFVIYSVAGSYFTFMEGAMPKLEKLNMKLHVSLAKNNGFYLGIQHLPCLKEVAVSLYEVDASPFEIRAAAATIRNEACIHPNCPAIAISGKCYERQCAEISSDEEDLR